MRDYARFSPKFWVGDTGRELRRRGLAHQVLAAYLITSPHSNMIGLYYLPVLYMAHETGIAAEQCRAILTEFRELGFCTYDESTEVVWVHEGCRFQLGDSKGLGDKQRIGAVRVYEAAPQSVLLDSFFDHYQGFLPFRLRREALPKASASPSEALPKGVGDPCHSQHSKENSKEQENSTGGALLLSPATVPEQVETAEGIEGLLASWRWCIPGQLKSALIQQAQRIVSAGPVARRDLEHAKAETLAKVPDGQDARRRRPGLFLSILETTLTEKARAPKRAAPAEPQDPNRWEGLGYAGR